MLAESELGRDYRHVVHLWEPHARTIVAGGELTLQAIRLGNSRHRLRGGLAAFPTMPQVNAVLPPVAAREARVFADLLADADKGVRFVKACRNLHATRRAANAIKEIVQAVYPEAAAENIASRLPMRDWLVRGRIRFDATVTLFMRHVFRTLMLTAAAVVLTLFVDGSPTSGYEAFLAVENMSSPCQWWSRQLPIAFLDYGAGNLTSKIFQLLFKIYCETGPDTVLMRWRLRHTRFVCSDQGTESGIADAADILNDFYIWLGSPCRVEPTRFLFPLCVYSAGWHHRFDHILIEVRRG